MPDQDPLLTKAQKTSLPIMEGAVATAVKAQVQGITKRQPPETQFHAEATQIIQQARESTRLLMKEKLIAPLREYG